MRVDEESDDSGVLDLAKKRTNREGPGSGGKQVAFRAPDEMHERLEFVSAGLGVDMSNLLRMIVSENLHRYVRRVEELKKEQGGGAD